MAVIKEHCKDCKKFLKDEMAEVHRFLDQYASMFPVVHFMDYHRTFLHNTYGMYIVLEKWGRKGWAAAMLHLTRDYVEGTIDHWTFGNMAKEFPRRLMWFNTMAHTYEPMPHVVRAWGGKGLVALATED
jgi:hypothetical protein